MQRLEVTHLLFHHRRVCRCELLCRRLKLVPCSRQLLGQAALSAEHGVEVLGACWGGWVAGGVADTQVQWAGFCSVGAGRVGAIDF